jgi:hypothetical protein
MAQKMGRDFSNSPPPPALIRVRPAADNALPRFYGELGG